MSLDRLAARIAMLDTKGELTLFEKRYGKLLRYRFHHADVDNEHSFQDSNIIFGMILQFGHPDVIDGLSDDPYEEDPVFEQLASQLMEAYSMAKLQLFLTNNTSSEDKERLIALDSAVEILMGEVDDEDEEIGVPDFAEAARLLGAEFAEAEEEGLTPLEKKEIWLAHRLEMLLMLMNLPFQYSKDYPNISHAFIVEGVQTAHTTLTLHIMVIQGHLSIDVVMPRTVPMQYGHIINSTIGKVNNMISKGRFLYFPMNGGIALNYNYDPEAPKFDEMDFDPFDPLFMDNALGNMGLQEFPALLQELMGIADTHRELGYLGYDPEKGPSDADAGEKKKHFSEKLKKFFKK